MRFFAINLASKGTARLSILPLSWATMSCAFQAIRKEKHQVLYLSFSYILRFGTPPATQVWLSYNAQGQLFVGSTFIAHLYRFIL